MRDYWEPLPQCEECGDVIEVKDNSIYHKIYHNKGRTLCYNCYGNEKSQEMVEQASLTQLVDMCIEADRNHPLKFFKEYIHDLDNGDALDFLRTAFLKKIYSPDPDEAERAKEYVEEFLKNYQFGVWEARQE